eukprot:11191954-Lingulodinium_polyedra.AAC.1
MARPLVDWGADHSQTPVGRKAMIRLHERAQVKLPKARQASSRFWTLERLRWPGQPVHCSAMRFALGPQAVVCRASPSN